MGERQITREPPSRRLAKSNLLDEARLSEGLISDTFEYCADGEDRLMRHCRDLLIRIFFIGLSLAFAGRGDAQTTQDVPIGGSGIVERASQPIVVTDPKPAVGAAAAATDPRDNANVLVYVAPPSGREGDSVTVNYTVGGTAKQALVTIRQPAPTLTDPRFYEASFKAIFVLFTLAILVESGLALLFRWRPYIDNFDRRTVNPIVAFVFSFLFVEAFNLDVTQSLVNVYSGTHYPSGTAGSILTALIIAGGSAGVRRILEAFGFRAPLAVEEAPPTPPDQQAWIAVSVDRDRSVGPIDVHIGKPGEIALAGTITGTGHRSGFLRYVLRDRARFPTTGGYRVEPGEYEVRVIGRDANGKEIPEPTWGPAKIANRAIVDLNFKI
jgi:hypothetical protein